MFDGGELQLVLLHLTEARPRHGYDLIREIEAMTGGAYAPSPGVVYPTLTLLEEMGQLEPQAAEGAKREYALTDAGRTRLADQAAVLQAALERLKALREADGRLEAGPVWRAMENLKAVLRPRLHGADREAMLAVADLLDEAARKIERLP